MGEIELVGAGEFRKEVMQPREVVRWVAGVLRVSGVSASDAPNSECWAALCWARTDEKEFWRVWSRLMPTRERVNKQDEVEDSSGREASADLLRDALLEVKRLGGT